MIRPLSTPLSVRTHNPARPGHAKWAALPGLALDFAREQLATPVLGFVCGLFGAGVAAGLMAGALLSDGLSLPLVLAGGGLAAGAVLGPLSAMGALRSMDSGRVGGVVGYLVGATGALGAALRAASIF